jgi:hypothetical protein
MRFEALDPALDVLGARVAELAGAAYREPAAVRLRRFGPGQQVVARLELAGPQRRLASMHAGVDVRGDGSTEAYLGRVRRTVLEPRPGEDAVTALRRALLES